MARARAEEGYLGVGVPKRCRGSPRRSLGGKPSQAMVVRPVCQGRNGARWPHRHEPSHEPLLTEAAARKPQGTLGEGESLRRHVQRALPDGTLEIVGSWRAADPEAGDRDSQDSGHVAPHGLLGEPALGIGGCRGRAAASSRDDEQAAVMSGELCVQGWDRVLGSRFVRSAGALGIQSLAHACTHACARAWVHACVHPRACVHPCARACIRMRHKCH